MLRTVGEHTPVGHDEFRISELAELFERPDGGDERDRRAFRYFLALSGDPNYQPVLLVEPTAFGWWLIDGIHRAAALYSARRVTGTEVISLPVFVLPTQLA